MNRTFRIARIAAAWFLTIALAVPNPAGANGPTVGFDGGGVVPLANSNIQLVHETVDLYATLSDEYTPGRASCHYVLANPSAKSRRISMSFVGGYGDAQFGPPPTPTEFRVHVG